MVTHNIQFGVSIDDESIQRGVLEGAVRDIQLGLFGRPVESRWGNPTFSREFMNSFLYDYMDRVFADEKLRELIADKTAELLAEKLMRSNKFKDAVKDGTVNRG